MLAAGSMTSYFLSATQLKIHQPMGYLLPQDLLTQRLNSLADSDLKSLIVGGLRVPESRVDGLSHAELVELCGCRLCFAAGSTTANFLRRTKNQRLPYKQVLIDVADRLAPGVTPLSWTKYRLGDGHTEESIEEYVLALFEERTRKWWDSLSDKKRARFVDGLNSVLAGEAEGARSSNKGPIPLLQQQALENLIQAGLVTGLSKVSAGGLLGVAGVSLIGQLGWLILVQTVGWMAGVKIAVFGVGGYGAFGGAVTTLGTAAVGAVIALPGVLYFIDTPAYRKTVPTTIMLVAKTRLDSYNPDLE